MGLAGEPAQADHGGKAIVGSWPVPLQCLQAGPAHDRAEYCGHDDGVIGIAQDRDDVDGDGKVGQQQPQAHPDAPGQRPVAGQAPQQPE